MNDPTPAELAAMRAAIRKDAERAKRYLYSTIAAINATLYRLDKAEGKVPIVR